MNNKRATGVSIRAKDEARLGRWLEDEAGGEVARARRRSTLCSSGGGGAFGRP